MRRHQAAAAQQRTKAGLQALPRARFRTMKLATALLIVLVLAPAPAAPVRDLLASCRRLLASEGCGGPYSTCCCQPMLGACNKAAILLAGGPAAAAAAAKCGQPIHASHPSHLQAFLRIRPAAATPRCSARPSPLRRPASRAPARRPLCASPNPRWVPCLPNFLRHRRPRCLRVFLTPPPIPLPPRPGLRHRGRQPLLPAALRRQRRVHVCRRPEVRGRGRVGRLVRRLPAPPG